MYQQQTQGLVKKLTLSETDLAAIRQLVDICNRHDHLHMRLFWDMLRERPGNSVHDFLYYEDNKLVGYISMDGSGRERELTGIVHPAYRRLGICRTLLDAVKDECKRESVARIFLVCEHASNSGQAFLQAIGARHSLSEHEMVLANFQPRYAFDDRLIFRQAEDDDMERILACFEEEGELIRPLLIARWQDPSVQFYIATFGEESVGCKEPVGTLRVYDWEDTFGIYGFVVISAYRGRGYGRQMLEELIPLLCARSSKPIMLEVDVTNTHALGLYQSCGFQIKTTYGYYEVTL